MDATLHALGNLLLEAIPTIIFFLFLYLFLQQVFFRPLARVLEERRKSTEGIKALSEEAFADADRKQSEFERALQLARQEISAENEKQRQRWIEEEAAEVAEARLHVERKRNEAKVRVQAELERAHSEMESQIDGITAKIVDALLTRRAA